MKQNAYTKLQIIKEARIKIVKQENRQTIAQWAYKVFIEINSKQNTLVHEIAYTLSGMCCASNFEYSYKELHDIADKLIADENARL